MKIRLVGAELFYADRQKDRHGDIIDDFRNFSKAPKNTSWGFASDRRTGAPQ